MATGERRQLGRTGLAANRLGLGTGQIGMLPADRAVPILQKALDAGIDFFDTSRVYGEAEAHLGVALAGRDTSSAVFTKTSAAEYYRVRKDIDTSLKNLDTERIAVYGLHGVDRMEVLDRCYADGAVAALEEAAGDVNVQHIGISSHVREVAVEACRRGPFSVAMVPCNLGLTGSARAALGDLAALGAGTVAMKPLGGGMLVAGTGNAELRERYPFLTLDNALAAVMRIENLDVVAPGVASVDELDQLLAAVDRPRSAGDLELDELDRRVASLLGDNYCRFCRYCCPCTIHGPAYDIPVILLAVAMHDRFDMPREARAVYRSLPLDGRRCEECGDCEEKCAFGLPIVDLLQRAAELFED